MAKATCKEDGCPKLAVARGLCSSHWSAWRKSVGDDFVSLRGNPVARFWEKVDKRGPDDCWPWTGSIEHTGYGHYLASLDGVRFTKAHRFAYHLMVGPVPEGLDLDHLCHTNDETCRARNDCPHRRCCNPRHAEPVTEVVNIMRSRSRPAENARKTHCIRGHPFSGDNLVIQRSGHRQCRECHRAWHRADQAKKRKERAAVALQSPGDSSPLCDPPCTDPKPSGSELHQQAMFPW